MHFSGSWEVGKLGSFSSKNIYNIDFQLLSNNSFSLAIGRHRAFKPAGNYPLLWRRQELSIIHCQLSITQRGLPSRPECPR